MSWRLVMREITSVLAAGLRECGVDGLELGTLAAALLPKRPRAVVRTAAMALVSSTRFLTHWFNSHGSARRPPQGSVLVEHLPLE